MLQEPGTLWRDADKPGSSRNPGDTVRWHLRALQDQVYSPCFLFVKHPISFTQEKATSVTCAVEGTESGQNPTECAETAQLFVCLYEESCEGIQALLPQGIIPSGQTPSRADPWILGLAGETWLCCAALTVGWGLLPRGCCCCSASLGCSRETNKQTYKQTQDVCKSSLVMLSQQEAGLGHCRLRGFVCVRNSRVRQGTAYTDTQHSCPSTGSRSWYPQSVILDGGFQPPRRSFNEV